MIPSPLHPHPQLAPGEREASPAAQRRRFDDGPQSMERALQLERPTSALAQPLDGRPAALILFSGPPTAAGGPSTLERELEAAGFRVVAFDKLAGGQAHDLSLADLQSEIRRRVRSGEFAFIFAGTPCSPYSIARGGAECPPLHTANGPVTPCPPGWEAHRAMHDGFIEFTCDVFRDGAAVAALCILENPADVSAPGPAHWAAKAHHGSIFKTAAVRKLCDDMHLLTLDFAQCAFASAYRKWTTFLFSAELYDLIAGWRHFGCTHGFGKHPDVAYGRDELGAAKSARAAAYPEALNQAIAALAAAFLARRTPPDGPPGVGRAADGPASRRRYGRRAKLRPPPPPASLRSATSGPPATTSSAPSRSPSFDRRTPRCHAARSRSPTPGPPAGKPDGPSPSSSCTDRESTPHSSYGSRTARSSCSTQRSPPTCPPTACCGRRRAAAAAPSGASARPDARPPAAAPTPSPSPTWPTAPSNAPGTPPTATTACQSRRRTATQRSPAPSRCSASASGTWPTR